MPETPTFSEGLYGFNQEALRKWSHDVEGRRVKKTPKEYIVSLRSDAITTTDLTVTNLTATTSTLATVTATTLTTTTLKDGGGVTAGIYKNINTPTGYVIASGLTDTLNLTSSNNTVAITPDNSATSVDLTSNVTLSSEDFSLTIDDDDPTNIDMTVAFANHCPTRVNQASQFDATTVATKSFFWSVPVGEIGAEPNKFAIDHVLIRVRSFTSGGKAVQAVINIGANSANYDDYISAKTVTVSAADTWIRLSVDDAQKVYYTDGQEIFMKITTASDATTEVWDAFIFGWYIPEV